MDKRMDRKVKEPADTLILKKLKMYVMQERFEEALALIAQIDVDRIKTAPNLCLVGEVYMYKKMYDEAESVFVKAYDKSPSNRRILGMLTNLYIEMGDYGEAEYYYKEFINVASRDLQRYILRYRLDKAKGERTAVLIDTLERLKDYEYTEEWAYELAELYHRSGDDKKALKECEEIILWFGHGDFVNKAVTLKCLIKGEPVPEFETNDSEEHMVEYGIDESITGIENHSQTKEHVEVDDDIDRLYEIVPGETVTGLTNPSIDIALIEKMLQEKEMTNQKNAQAFKAQMLKAEELTGEASEKEAEAESEEATEKEAEAESEEATEKEAEAESEEAIEKEAEAESEEATEKEAEAEPEEATEKETEKEDEDVSEKIISEEVAVDPSKLCWDKLFETLQEIEDKVQRVENGEEILLPKEMPDDILRFFDEAMDEDDVVEKEISDEGDVEEELIEEIASNEDIDNVNIEEITTDEVIEDIEEIISDEDVEDIEDVEEIFEESEDDLKQHLTEKMGEQALESPKSATQLLFDALSADESMSFWSERKDRKRRKRKGFIAETLTEDIEESVTQNHLETKEKDDDLQKPDFSAYKFDEAYYEQEFNEQEADIQDTVLNEEDDFEEISEDLPVEDSLFEEDDFEDEIIDESEEKDPMFEEDFMDDELFEDEFIEEESIEEESIEEELMDDELFEDESIEDESIEEELMDDELFEDESIEEALFAEDLFDEESDAEKWTQDDHAFLDTVFADKKENDLFASIPNVSSVKEQLSKTFTKFEEAEISKVDILADYEINFVVLAQDHSMKAQIALGIAKALNTYGRCDKSKLVRATADELNKRNFAIIFKKLSGGCLIVEDACRLSEQSVNTIETYVSQGDQQTAIVLESTNEEIIEFWKKYPSLRSYFLNVINVSKYNEMELVTLAKGYLEQQKYELDPDAALVLRDRFKKALDCNQVINYENIINMMDAAIASLEKRNVKNLYMTVLDNKYEEASMFVIRPEDLKNL